MPDETGRYHIAQMNVATALFALDDPRFIVDMSVRRRERFRKPARRLVVRSAPCC